VTDTKAPRVVAVVVAYNRRELLQECLTALAAQTRPVEATVVVDNASDDGTGDMVRDLFPGVDLVTLVRNTGGAGGFTVGIERALAEHEADLVWIMDDDTIPEPTALAELLRVREARPELVLQASRAIWTDGTEHPMNTPKARIGASRTELERAAAHDALPVRSASFVSLLLSADAIRGAGMPVADYFLWNDDFEYTSRILRRAEGWYCRSSVVMHKTKVLGSSDADPGERFYFEVRNKLWLFRFSRAFGAGERLLYIAATGRRWLRTWARSSDRSTLSAAGRRGWREGWARRPRPNAEVLDGAERMDGAAA
jgi:rhamnopyranosyl-N-acetylglucosaminyl-diphospho-decaprenol beta-1,3/1,4-galactofuranosyltransferase